MAAGKKEGRGDDATGNGLLIFLRGLNLLITGKRLDIYLLKIGIADEYPGAGPYLVQGIGFQP